MEGSFNSKTSFIISDDRSFFALKISTVRTYADELLQSYLPVIVEETWIDNPDM